MTSATQEQVMALLDFLEDHPQLAKGKLRHLEARQEGKRLWENITQVLNGLGGASKSAMQWQKVWADKKFIAKSKAAERARGATGTGGGPAVGGKLTDVDLRVLHIMGEGFGGPQTGAVVNPFETPEQVRQRLAGSPRPQLSVPQPQPRQPISQLRLRVAPPREHEHAVAVRQRRPLPATPPRQPAPQPQPQPCSREAQPQQMLQDDDHSYALPAPEEARVQETGDEGAVGSQERRPPSRLARTTHRRRLVPNNSVERLVASEEAKIEELKNMSSSITNMTVILNSINTSLEKLVEVLTKK